MNYESYIDSITKGQKPGWLSVPLSALWEDKSGDWDEAHNIVQADDSIDASWVHAYLHRAEGDTFNANYWYSQAGKPFFEGTLDEEWKQLVKVFI